ncbi:ATP-binding cassette domain-containing protein [Christiangramia sabulilitoris]|uniref:UvrABC system protein A n=1 Tax=Christiangramia sabulilitoris TaxID=2583991 RepID=A0A550HXV4_9FLAO|nr:ATP-binding cassette domain-containing protein [Christiangramia sabulilitoris]TRO63348.1 ATP-binding cassette domain-containing protein [Christiangramia sabulilitoris]
MRIINAHQNNLKNIDLDIPVNQLIVITGLSGSGKSSLAMDVIANEGYRYFLESLSAYNQQNARAIPTAEVDAIESLPPVIRVEQSKRFQTLNATFGTLSEIAAIFRIIFARYSAEEALSKSLFSFNHPKGACERCHGIGQAEYIDIDKLVGDKSKTLRDGAINTTLPNGYIVYSQITVEELNKVCQAHGFNVDIPWKDLSVEQQEVILNGSDRIKVFFGKHSIESRLRWKGLKAKPREEGFYKGILPIMNDILKRDRNPNILKFVSSKLCPECKGARIKPEHLKFEWKGLNFQDWMDLTLTDLYTRLQSQDYTAGEKLLVDKINTALIDLINLGMGEYCLSTPSSEISSGDGQRIKLIRQVNSNLQGILYVFDEPSIGLPENYQRFLLYIFKRLISRGNTVMVVEHDLNFIRSADWIVELGPGAGIHGGEVIFNGAVSKFLKAENISSPTLEEIAKLDNRPVRPQVFVDEAAFQLQKGSLNVVSRKSFAILDKLNDHAEKNDLNLLMVTDQPIGKTPRSNPATYTGLADGVRDLFAKTTQAKNLQLSKGAFSFNNKAGRCENCEGAGVITLSMSLMGSINQVCPTCNGKRFKPEVLKVNWNGKNISEVYDLGISEAYKFFTGESKISRILSLMIELGLGYIKLGQPSNTLSGGEAQRIKLTKHFARQSKRTLLVMEEPGIGLHQQNVRQMLQALHRLKKETAGIICFENNELFQNSADVWLDNSLKAEPTYVNEIHDLQKDEISLRGARTHHLKDLNVSFPKNQLTVITGISGSGKSSLAIDTLHGYGLQEMTKQFSAYQQSRTGVNFQLDVDHIEGLSPTICISRKEKSFTERSDIAKQTGIEKILRFAFSRKAQYLGKELSASHFSNNHDLGKCPVCDGIGEELLPDINKIVRDSDKSISEGLFEHNKALAYYGQADSQFMAIVNEIGSNYDFNLETPFKDLTRQQIKILFHGTGETEWTTQWNFKTRTRKGIQEVKMPWKGLFNYLKEEYYKTRKNKNIEKLKDLFEPSTCSKCSGSGLKPGRLEFKIVGSSFHEIKSLDFKGLQKWLSLKTDEEIDQKLIAGIRPMVENTIKRATQLHIDHLQLNRKSITLSGGENQRVAIITQLNSPLTGITYLLDEPSAGLSRDNIPDLIHILKEIISRGNTVIAIEHNKEIIFAGDHLIQLGPQAGKLGGYITFEGTPGKFLNTRECHPFLQRQTKPFLPEKGKESIKIKNLSRYTLKKDYLEIPVGSITAISGKSGIGKTTLVKEILIPSIERNTAVNCGNFQSPKRYNGAKYFETRKLRSHATTLLVTYLDLLKEISKIFAGHTGLKARDFSYKNKASQCPNCKGKGFIETSLDVAANIIEKCEVCKGLRYQEHVLAHRVDAQNIAQVLALNLEELRNWLGDKAISDKILRQLDLLKDIGLGHLGSDQPVQSLSSGEKQRLLLLNWLQSQENGMLYVLDEPSTGLHFEDLDLLFDILKKLGKQNDILIIDHHPYLLEKIGIGMTLN